MNTTVKEIQFHIITEEPLNEGHNLLPPHTNNIQWIYFQLQTQTHNCALTVFKAASPNSLSSFLSETIAAVFLLDSLYRGKATQHNHSTTQLKLLLQSKPLCNRINQLDKSMPLN